MRNRRPINQAILHDQPVAYGLPWSFFRPSVKALNEVLAVMKRVRRQIAIDLSVDGLVTVTPSRRVAAGQRRVATQLRRRDRKKARQR